VSGCIHALDLRNVFVPSSTLISANVLQNIRKPLASACRCSAASCALGTVAGTGLGHSLETLSHRRLLPLCELKLFALDVNRLHRVHNVQLRRSPRCNERAFWCSSTHARTGFSSGGRRALQSAQNKKSVAFGLSTTPGAVDDFSVAAARAGASTVRAKPFRSGGSTSARQSNGRQCRRLEPFRVVWHWSQ